MPSRDYENLCTYARRCEKSFLTVLLFLLTILRFSGRKAGFDRKSEGHLQIMAQSDLPGGTDQWSLSQIQIRLLPGDLADDWACTGNASPLLGRPTREQ